MSSIEQQLATNRRETVEALAETRKVNFDAIQDLDNVLTKTKERLGVSGLLFSTLGQGTIRPFLQLSSAPAQSYHGWHITMFVFKCPQKTHGRSRKKQPLLQSPAFSLRVEQATVSAALSESIAALAKEVEHHSASAVPEALAGLKQEFITNLEHYQMAFESKM